MKKYFIFSFIMISAQFVSSQSKPLPKKTDGACCAFSVYNSAASQITIEAGKENVIIFDAEYFDDANAWNNIKYKAPVSGTYLFDFTLTFLATNQSADIQLIKVTLQAGERQTDKLVNVPGNYRANISAGMQGIFKLKAGEEVMVNATSLSSSLTAVTSANGSVFSGVKLY